MTIPKWVPKWVQDLVITVLLPLAKAQGKVKVVEYLNKLHTSEPNWYGTAVIISYRLLVVHLKPIADDTSTPYDNEAVDLVISALAQSAAEHGIALPDVTIIAVPVLPAPIP